MTSPASVRSSTRITASPRDVFSLVSKYENAVKVIDGLASLTPLGEETRQAGARFRAVFRVAGKNVTSEVELVELDEERRVRWQSTGATERSVLFELRPVEEGLTAVRVTVTYERLDGLAGVVLSRFVEETVRSSAKSTLEALRRLATAL